jgi:hypothetical protein
MHSLRGRREDVPALLLFYECKKIVLSFNLKLQFVYPFALQGLKAVVSFHPFGTAEAVP